jgi:protein TonB
MVKYCNLLFLLLCGILVYGQDNDSIYRDELVTYIESAPLFKGDLAEFIAGNIKYPKTAQRDSLEGTVFISYWVDRDGSTINHKIEKGVRKDLNDEALRVAKLIHYEKPAMQKGKAIKVRFVVPVEFYLHPPYSP